MKVSMKTLECTSDTFGIFYVDDNNNNLLFILTVAKAVSYLEIKKLI